MDPTDIVLGPVQWLTANAGSLIAAFVILVVGLFVSGLVARTIVGASAGNVRMDRTFAPLLSQTARYGILIVAIIMALNMVGVPSTSIIAVLGAAGLAIALALQGTLTNIAAGIMLVWQRPVAVGEYVVGDGVEGEIVEIGLFGTRLRSASGLFLFTPNQKLWNGVITNHSREPNRRVQIDLTLPASANLARARGALLAAAAEEPHVLQQPAPTVHVATLTADNATLRLRAWVKTADYRAGLYAITERARSAITLALTQSGDDAGSAHVAAVEDPQAQPDP